MQLYLDADITEISSQRKDMDSSCHAALHSCESPTQPSDKYRFETYLVYNVGKFLRLQGGVIARFVKKVFEKPFKNTQIQTIEQKLRESKSTKERILIQINELNSQNTNKNSSQ